MSWFRLYDEVVDDPKVQMLPPLLFRAWINCLCIAKKNDGVLPHIKDVAYRLHLSMSRTETVIKDLIQVGLFEECNGQVVPHNWDGRQFQSDNVTARVKRFRERSKKPGSNVSETADETDQIQRQIQSTDTETEQKPPIVPRPPKTAYGKFDNVLLSDSEMDTLDSKFGEQGCTDRIEALSEYLASKGKHYKNHYATILTWERKNGNGPRETKSEEFIRKQHEAGERARELLRGTTGDAFGRLD